jgi:hypothetical protein
MTNPANQIINRLGGVYPVARALSVNPSTVFRWTIPSDRGGTDGVIPAKRQRELLRLAQEKGVPLAPADFFDFEDSI